MTESTDTQPLTDEAVDEILALRRRNTGPSFGYVHELCTAIDALCATVKQLRTRIQLLESQWCECGHLKTVHGFFSDHDECYECDQASPDLCCEWRPVARPNTQLEQLREENEGLRIHVSELQQELAETHAAAEKWYRERY